MPPYIIIPVYRGLAATRACLESVRRHSADHRLVLINDASPEPEATRLLQAYAAEHANIHLIENTTNLGFVRSINLGLAYDTGRDVILLNSDTVVTPGWVEKLTAWAACDGRVATVTPFSNNATICSYPIICRNNALPDGLSASELNALFEEAYNRMHPAGVELPTGIGFCMYVRRAFINLVGEFNHAVFGQGYGEENDFCLRCAQQGGRHVTALDTFIFHIGETSFGSDAATRCDTAQTSLKGLHPHYPVAVETFLEADPLAVMRRQVDLLRYAARPRPSVLLIEHGLGGGTHRHVADLARLWSDRDWHPFILTPANGGGCVLASGLPTEEFEVVLEGANWLISLLQLLSQLNMHHIHFHHTWGFSDDIYELPRASGLPFDITLHDYYAICPRANGFLPEAVFYCGFELRNDCDGCLQTARFEKAGTAAFVTAGNFTTIAAWRHFQQHFLDQASQVIAPSQTAATIYARFFPNVPVRVLPHPEFGLPARRQPNVPGNILNVCILGGISPQKGRRLLAQLVALTRTHRLPLRWVVIGTTDIEGERDDPDFIVTGEYQRNDLPDIFDRYSINVGLLPALWPETFSYVLSECWFLGVPVIAPDIGAFPERMALRRAGWLLNSPITPEGIIDKLIDIANNPHDFFLKCRIAQSFKAVNPADYLALLMKNSNTIKRAASPASIEKDCLGLVAERIIHHRRKHLQRLLTLKKNELTLTHNHVINLENSLNTNMVAVDILNKTNRKLQEAVEGFQQGEAYTQTQQHIRNLETIIASLRLEIETQLLPRVKTLEEQTVAQAAVIKRFKLHLLVKFWKRVQGGFGRRYKARPD